MKLSSLSLIALLLTTSVSAYAVGPEPAPAASTPFKVGTLSVASLADAKFVLPNDGKIFGANVGPDAVAEVLKAAQAPTDLITLSVDALLVRDGKHVVLIDTGLGPKVGGSLLESLKLAGVTPDQVTDVMITHSHPDHIGGLVSSDGHSAFPKAKIHFSAPDWAAIKGAADKADFVQAIGAQVNPFQPGAKLTPSIRSVSIKGHTPGHVGYEIRSGKQHLLDIGDTAHSAIISLAKPDWNMGFDEDKDTAKTSRRKTLAELAASHEIIFAPHFPYPGIGYIEASGEGFSWKPASLSGTAK